MLKNKNTQHLWFHKDTKNHHEACEKTATTRSAVPSATSSEARVETAQSRDQVSRKLVISFSYQVFSLLCHTHPPPTGNGHKHSFCLKGARCLRVQKE